MIWLHRGAVVVVFVASRVALWRLGMRFDTDNLAEFWQLLDPVWLRQDLWRSLYYLHAQPPLFNLLVGGAMLLFGDGWSAALSALYGLTSLVGLLALLDLARLISGRPRFALGLTLLVAVAPATLLYEHKLYYEGLVTWLLVLGIALLYRWHQGVGWAGVAGFACLATVVLLRSAFHPVWFLACVSIMIACEPTRWRRVLLAAALPALAIGGVMFKNQLVFGSTALSSWGGINLARMMIEPLPPHLRAVLIADGELTPLAAVRPFSDVAAYQAVTGRLTDTGVTVLDAPEKTSGWTNYNNHVYAKVGPLLIHDSLIAVSHYPSGYATRVATALYHFNRPPSEFRGLEANLAVIAPWDRLYSLVVEGQPAAWFGAAADPARPAGALYQPGYLNVAVTLTSLAACALILMRVARGGTDERRALAGSAVLAVTLLYAVAACTLLDVWENNRARFMIEPLMLVTILGLWPRRAVAEGRAGLIALPIADPITVVLGSELDDALYTALVDVLRSLGAQPAGPRRWSAEGSQERDQLDMLVGGDLLHIEAESRVGLSITGAAPLIRRIRTMLSG